MPLTQTHKLDRAIGCSVSGCIVTGCTSGLGFNVGGCTVAKACYSVVVIDLICRCDTGATCHCTGNGTYDCANRAASCCTYNGTAHAAKDCALFCVVARIVINSMLNVVVCHIDHCSFRLLLD
jgi:hypothetical protein